MRADARGVGAAIEARGRRGGRGRCFCTPTSTSRTKRAWSNCCAKRCRTRSSRASHHVSREQREYERTSTVAANAYVGPRVSTYLERLERHLDGDGFNGNLLIMQSSGGLCDVATAREQCIQMLESGPAGGVVASQDRRRRARARQRDLLRHGRHDRQSVRAASRRGGALDRLLHRRLQRRSGDPHSGARHQGSRHRRRQHRLGR